MQIMEDWKNKRFIVLTGLIQDFDWRYSVLLSDYNFWADNADKLAQWCTENNCKQEGMLVNFPDEKTLSLFCLRWS
jgi:hypothetical protein